MIRKINLKTESPSLLHVQKKSYVIEAELIGFPNLPPLKDTVLTIQNSNETFIGYFLNDAIVGAISYEIEENILHICRLFVDPDHFRKGIAESLLKYALETNTFHKAIVGTGAVNTPAIRLYEKLGFVIKEQMLIEEELFIIKMELNN